MTLGAVQSFVRNDRLPRCHSDRSDAQHRAVEESGLRRYNAFSGIAREKQLKRWRREKKLRLITKENPGWRDLSDGWYG